MQSAVKYFRNVSAISFLFHKFLHFIYIKLNISKGRAKQNIILINIIFIFSLCDRTIIRYNLMHFYLCIDSSLSQVKSIRVMCKPDACPLLTSRHLLRPNCPLVLFLFSLLQVSHGHRKLHPARPHSSDVNRLRARALPLSLYSPFSRLSILPCFALP